MARLSMLIDLTRCIGCDACTVACKQENGTPVDVFFARVINVEAGSYPNVKRVYIPVLCNHCDDAPCLKSCPNKAIFRRPDGIVLIDQDRCKGTGACVSACPYGNIYLNKVDSWYLLQEERYERDFVKPRLKNNVARKCTYCAQRVDEGLNPACVVACPTNARIFGDLEDAESEISRYIVDQEQDTGRKPFHLLPEAKTKPAGCYLSTMSEQQPATLGGAAPYAQKGEALPEAPTVSRTVAQLVIFVLAFLFLTIGAYAQPAKQDVYSTSTCVGCHGISGMGGLGPPLAQTKLTLEEFRLVVREGKGMMPKVPEDVLAAKDLDALHLEVKAQAWDDTQIPIAYKIGQYLTTKNLSKFFMVLFGIAFLLGLKVLAYWLAAAGFRHLLPYIAKFGVLKAAWVALRSFVVDGLLVASLWRKNKPRWVMHGLMLYGMFGLLLADILMQIFNPARGHLPVFHPLKLLPMFSGIAVLSGVLYVMYRYKRDAYIDNGLTQGRDFLFVNLLLHTIVSGFMVVAINRSTQTGWVMPIYLYHLTSLSILIITAPFTRFAHAWVVPSLVAMTRLTEEIAKSGADIGFIREPSPGRHHKTERIAANVMKQVDPSFKGKIRIRYYP